MVRGMVAATTPATSFTSDVADAINDRQRLRLGCSGPRQATAGQISFPVSRQRERKRERERGNEIWVAVARRRPSQPRRRWGRPLMVLTTLHGL
ncbi:hypothetical protein CRG98_040211 [Punica granatum]|uniref:Uncharacterized protein n=1 Tax=Punica granatum TaxID=22663 RepID=A0A2I0I5R8_PUNGR|nr:hypothetical protein CRG98_040211 [Punica granatum]